MITLRTMLDLQTKSFNKLHKIMYEYQLRKFVIKELTPAPLTRVLFAAVRIARKKSYLSNAVFPRIIAAALFLISTPPALI